MSLNRLWIETGSGNRISRQATIKKAQNIELDGNSTICPSATLDASVSLVKPGSAISMGLYCFVGENCLVTPPMVGVRMVEGQAVHFHSKMTIGSHVVLGSGSVVKAHSIGDNVSVGEHCVLGNGCVVSSNCIIRDYTIIPDRAVLAPFSEVKSVDGRMVIKELSHGYSKFLREHAKEQYLR